MSPRTLFAIGLLAVGLSACGRHDNSGIYLGKEAAADGLVQLVEASDHHVTGRLETRRINTDGSIADDVYVIDGAASGSDMTLIFHPTWTTAGLSATAHRDGDALSISLRGETRTLKRGSLKDHQRDDTDLSKHAADVAVAYRQVQAAEAARKAAQADFERSSALVRSLDAFAQNAENGLKNYEQTRASYIAAGDMLPKRTAEMRALLAEAKAVTRGAAPLGADPKEKMQEILNHSVENFNKAKSLRDQISNVEMNWRSEFVKPEADCASLSANTHQEIRLNAGAICSRIRNSEKEFNSLGGELETAARRYISVVEVEGPEQIQLMKEARRSCLQLHNC